MPPFIRADLNSRYSIIFAPGEKAWRETMTDTAHPATAAPAAEKTTLDVIDILAVAD